MDSRSERQALAVKRWKEAKGNAIIEATTGFGKTRVALNIIKELTAKKPDLKVLVIVPQDNLKKQWEQQIPEDINSEVVIINSALNREYSVNLVIYDEIHTIASDQRIQILDRVHSNLTLGLTATIKRLDGLEHRILERFPICDTITMKESMDNGWISQSLEFKVLLDVDLEEYNKINKKFNEYHAFFGQQFYIANKCAHDWQERVKFARFLGCDVKQVNVNAFGFSRALKQRKEFVYNHPKKIEMANHIIEKLSDKKIITFSMSQDIAEKVKANYLYHSKMKKKERDKVIAEFSESKNAVLSTVKAADAGLDVQGLNCAIFIAGSSSEIQMIQRRGRCVRKEGDKVSLIFHLLLPGTIEMSWFANANKNCDPIPVLTEENLERLLNGQDYTVYQDYEKQAIYYS